MDVDEQIEWAVAEAQRIRSTAHGWHTGSGHVTNQQREQLCASAVEFLQRVAPGSVFAATAKRVIEREVDRHPYEQTAAYSIASQLEGWVTATNAGFAGALPYESRSRIDAATDLMEQVQTLLADKNVHPAAPVVLAGASLEEFLRSMQASTTAKVTGKPSLSTYAEALRREGKLTANDVKDVTAIAGIRNDAAHGKFDLVTIQRAHLMADQVNFFIRQHMAPPQQPTA